MAYRFLVSLFCFSLLAWSGTKTLRHSANVLTKRSIVSSYWSRVLFNLTFAIIDGQMFASRTTTTTTGPGRDTPVTTSLPDSSVGFAFCFSTSTNCALTKSRPRSFYNLWSLRSPHHRNDLFNEGEKAVRSTDKRQCRLFDKKKLLSSVFATSSR